MAKIKAKKVMTPGSVGHPRKKLKEKKGTKRLGNYRNKYTEETFLKALQAVKEHLMSLERCREGVRGPRNHADRQACREKGRQAGALHSAQQGSGRVTGGEDPGDGGVVLSTWQEGPHSHRQRLSGQPGQDNQVKIGTN
jgi:hypothetical protein